VLDTIIGAGKIACDLGANVMGNRTSYGPGIRKKKATKLGGAGQGACRAKAQSSFRRLPAGDNKKNISHYRLPTEAFSWLGFQLSFIRRELAELAAGAACRGPIEKPNGGIQGETKAPQPSLIFIKTGKDPIWSLISLSRPRESFYGTKNPSAVLAIRFYNFV